MRIRSAFATSKSGPRRNGGLRKPGVGESRARHFVSMMVVATNIAGNAHPTSG